MGQKEGLAGARVCGHQDIAPCIKYFLFFLIYTHLSTDKSFLNPKIQY